ncbi:homocysteine S-methyltransferase family protein [Natranaerobius thermophilus]|uniref:Methionine synthase n=1 Tax=Natranaerobius thermophilus (strain ATCC BAA-1301 / DSM 18059 / JW/NM-WN-LF) TaxID=457570 RepID=B2A781_NATTJ|nr:homocysteine S-methyltransferase family protein [Natranaerobius thermophilus]ACB84275.1 homocysteine S-methyltransferase [Natranaerobius thermophilus JW/NM-WN-LF]
MKLKDQLVNKTLEKLLFLDGSYGTELQRRGFEGNAEILNLQDQDLVKNVHYDYASAGADLILTNTFGGNRLKLKDAGYEDKVAEINSRGVELAKESAENIDRDVLVVGDISSTGRFIEPVGDLSFTKAQQVFQEQGRYLIESGVDLIKIETMTDIKELKAAILGIRSIDEDLPLIVSMSFEQDGKTITGTSVPSYVTLMNDLPVDIIGLNCGVKSKDMLDLVKQASYYSLKPLSISPNAGDPDLDLSYSEDPQEFSFYLDAISDLDMVAIVGGCCGTTPEYVDNYCSKLKGKEKSRKLLQQSQIHKDIPTLISSRTYQLDLDNNFVKIGERINPASKKNFQEEINNKDFSRIYDEAFSQMNEGSDVIDLNLGVEEDVELEDVETIVNGLDSLGCKPLSLDIQSSVLLEKALQVYPGRPIINSSSCDKEDLDNAIDLMKKYGGVLVLLAMSGTPKKTIQKRLDELKYGLEYLESKGIDESRIMVDPLVLPVGTEHDPKTTLELIKIISQEMECKTTLGLSNLSHGLPDRPQLNSAFVSMAIYNGLDSAIMDTSDQLVTQTVEKSLMLMGKETIWEDVAIDTEDQMVKDILTGNSDKVLTQVKSYLKDMTPLEVSQQLLGKAMKEIGDLYNDKSIYLPQLLLSAETVQPSFDYLNKLVGEHQEDSKGKIMLATVEGDVHDIGKKIVGTILKSGGFEIYDLGVDLPANEIVAEVKDIKPDILGLSAMMTSTIKKIAEVTEQLQAEGIDVKVIGGGASLNPELAQKFGCHAYAKDAHEALTKCEQLMTGEKALSNER